MRVKQRMLDYQEHDCRAMRVVLDATRGMGAGAYESAIGIAVLLLVTMTQVMPIGMDSLRHLELNEPFL